MNSTRFAGFLLLLLSCSDANTKCGVGTRIENDSCVIAADPSDDTPSPSNDSSSKQPDAGVSPPQTAPTEPTVAELPTESVGNCRKGAPGPVMVEVTGPSGPICIDATEVTQAQYAEFLQEAPTQFTDVVVCDRNRTYLPQGLGTTAEFECPTATPFDPEKRGDHPVVCVDWCDAQAFCEWAGKRLCGGDEGQLLLNGGEGAATADGEFPAACSQGGRVDFPYGDEYEPDRCSSDRVGPVGSYDCEGDGPTFNLVGNVAEWVGFCPYADEYSLTCFALGGGSLGTTGLDSPEAGCFQQRLLPADPRSGYIDVGFRCCADTE